MEALRSFLDPKGRRGGQKKEVMIMKMIYVLLGTRAPPSVCVRALKHTHTPRIDKKILTFQVIF